MIQLTAKQLEILESMQHGIQVHKTENKKTLNSLVKKGALKLNHETMEYELTPMGKSKIVK